MLGDFQSGYDYNKLLFQEDLSTKALYGKYFVIGIGILAIAYILTTSSRGRR